MEGWHLESAKFQKRMSEFKKVFKSLKNTQPIGPKRNPNPAQQVDLTKRSNFETASGTCKLWYCKNNLCLTRNIGIPEYSYINGNCRKLAKAFTPIGNLSLVSFPCTNNAPWRVKARFFFNPMLYIHIYIVLQRLYNECDSFIANHW